MIGGLKKLLFGHNDAEEAVAAGAHADAALHHAAAGLMVEAALLDGDFSEEERQRIETLLRERFELGQSETAELMISAEEAAADARRNASPSRTDASKDISSPARRRLSSSDEKTTACGTASTPSPGRRTRSPSWGTPPCVRCSGNSRGIPRARFEKGCATRERRSLSRETSGGGDEGEDDEDEDEDEDQSAWVRVWSWDEAFSTATARAGRSVQRLGRSI